VNEAYRSGVLMSSIQGARSQRLNTGGVLQRIRENGSSRANPDKHVYNKGHTGSEDVVLWLFPDPTLVSQLDARGEVFLSFFFLFSSMINIYT
jgi:hypothetical protein